jgi:dolichol-phosphate mannosyltransferase
MPTPHLSVVLPVWRQDHDLPRLLPSLTRTLDDLRIRWEVVLAVGRSGHPLRGHRETPSVEVVVANGDGYGEILKAGLARARGTYVATMDPDFRNPPSFVRTMWDHRSSGEAVLASRYVLGARAEMGFFRRLASRSLNLLYRKVLALGFRDISGGLRMYHRDVLQDIQPLSSRGLDILPEMLVKAYCRGWRVVEVPFLYRGARPWTRARTFRLGVGYLRTMGSLFALRNSVKSADYDHRAYDSWIPLQRYWQRRRFRIIQRFAADAGWVLDIGCGSSRIVQSLSHVVGTDLDIGKLRWLRGPGRHLVRADLNRMPFGDGAFDAVIASEVIEHVPREEMRMEQLVRVIRPGGLLILGTPDYGKRLWRTLEWIYGRVFPGGYAKEHINRYTYEELRRILEGELGLEVLECRYVGRSEMIFKARLPAGRPTEVPQPAVTAG